MNVRSVEIGRAGAAFHVALALVFALGARVGPVMAQPTTQPSTQRQDADVRSAVAADTIRVGDVIPVAVRVTIDPGERVAWPDTLPVGGQPVENAARVRERMDTLPDGRLQVTGIYSVTPWRTGELALPELALDVISGREVARSVSTSLPTLDVVSVLPPDTAGIEPKPPKGVIGRSWALWPFLVALLALAALVAGLVWWWRRRRAARAVEPAVQAVPPRERVLSRLQEAREAGLLERGAMYEFYSRVSWALREYIAELDGGWGEDLTTTELLARFRAQVGPEEARRLADVLRPADQVKFARRDPDADTALAEWEAGRAWVLEFRWPPRRAVDEREEAA